MKTSTIRPSHRLAAAFVAVTLTALPALRARASCPPPPPDPSFDLTWHDGCRGSDTSIVASFEFTARATGQFFDVDVSLTKTTRGAVMHADYYDANGILLGAIDLRDGKMGLTLTAAGRKLDPSSTASMLAVLADPAFMEPLANCVAIYCPGWVHHLKNLCIVAASLCCAFGVGPCCVAAGVCVVVIDEVCD